MAEGSRIDQRGQKVIGPQINAAGDVNLPPPSLVLVPHLPPLPRDFTGRDEELQDLLDGFDRGATITGLRGMGGIGKTALAYALAEKLADRYPDGQILVELRGTSPEPMTSAEAMAKVVRIYYPEAKLPEKEAELARIYHSLLHDLRVLLLLDNAASREQVEPLLPPSGCAAIVTSRNRFALPGLKAKDLDVLPLEDARKLLLEIADRIGSQAEELAGLCGCLPIALRNAASVLAERIDLGVAEYLKRLQEARNRVDLVEASFGLSYDLLSTELQRLWSILSVFPASFDREGATAVWALDQDSAASSLSNLVKWSLVEYDQTGERYHLHDLARDYASSRLPAEEKAEAEERHAEHYINVLCWLQTALAAAKGKEDRRRERNHLGNLGNAYKDLGEPCKAIEYYEQALAISEEIGDRRGEGNHLGNLGNAYKDLGEPRKAIDYYEQALAIAREIGDRGNEGHWMGNLGAAYAVLGEPRKAIEYYEQALAIAREIGDRRNEGINSWNLGLEYEKAGDIEQASDIMQLCVDFEREIGHPNAESDASYLENLRARLGKK